MHLPVRSTSGTAPLASTPGEVGGRATGLASKVGRRYCLVGRPLALPHDTRRAELAAIAKLPCRVRLLAADYEAGTVVNAVATLGAQAVAIVVPTTPVCAKRTAATANAVARPLPLRTLAGATAHVHHSTTVVRTTTMYV